MLGELDFSNDTTRSGEDSQTHTEAALAAFGLAPESPPVREPDPYFLWPENMLVLEAFIGLMTQWHVGPNGPTGMIWSELALCAQKNSRRARRLGAADSKHELMAFFKAMEAGVLRGYSERAERNQQQ